MHKKSMSWLAITIPLRLRLRLRERSRDRDKKPSGRVCLDRVTLSLQYIRVGYAGEITRGGVVQMAILPSIVGHQVPVDKTPCRDDRTRDISSCSACRGSLYNGRYQKCPYRSGGGLKVRAILHCSSLKSAARSNSPTRQGGGGLHRSWKR